MKIWSKNYSLHFGSVKIYKHCLYWKEFSTDIYRKIIFNYLLLFSLYLLVSKFYEFSQWIHNIFLTISETKARFVLPFVESLFPTLQYFFSFFHLVSKLFKWLFQSLCWSVNCMSWVFKLYNIFGGIQKLKH